MDHGLPYILKSTPPVVTVAEQGDGYKLTVRLPGLVGLLLMVLPAMYLLIYLVGGLIEGWDEATREVVTSEVGQFNVTGMPLLALFALHTYFQRVHIHVSREGVTSAVRIPIRRKRSWAWQDVDAIQTKEIKHTSHIQQQTYELQEIQVFKGEERLGTLITFMDTRSARWMTRFLKAYRQKMETES